MSSKILDFPKTIRKANEAIRLQYENDLCHKIFLEERIQDLELINKSHDLLKHASYKSRPLSGDIKFATLVYLNNPTDENWTNLKDLKISNKKSALEVWLYYKSEFNKDAKLSRDSLLNALKYEFDRELLGYKSRYNESATKVALIKEAYPSIDTQIDLTQIN